MFEEKLMATCKEGRGEKAPVRCQDVRTSVSCQDLEKDLSDDGESINAQ